MKKQIIFVGLIIIVFIIGIFALSLNSNNTPVKNGYHLTVVTTLFPLYDMARSVGKSLVDVTLLLPPGVEAHSFEPIPSDIIKINNADIFIYTGKFMEPWVKDILNSINNNKLIVVDASLDTKILPAVFHDADEPVGAPDPHIWLDFDNDKIIARHIKDALSAKDSVHTEIYQKNYDTYTDSLAKLDTRFEATLSHCNTQEIIYAGHYAFGYLAKRYDLKYFAAQGISPNSEPTATDLANLVNQIKQNKIKYIFYEELSSPKVAQTIAQETNAQILLLNAGHNISKDQLNNNVTFFDIMNFDLNNLKIGLECK